MPRADRTDYYEWKRHPDKLFYAENIDYRMSVGMSFKLETPHLFGLPERKQEFKLNSTLLYKAAEEQPKPYRFFNKDQFLSENSRDSLYGSIPYLTGHATDHDSSILWVNSAETWVDLFLTDVDAGRVNQEYDESS